ncbi:pyridoxamine 5'-phosphate oxidase family protein [Halorientalis litorea]|uniref:pyridoxamine 5'-phosphate oxidase family protein n=1 Tax=Halorientalis litorea TaxID=2931977 RepID=UPI001FF3BD6C|nr:pyridoxamine 5'-phosphate oxidase family protein [Halorientalis litorea]
MTDDAADRVAADGDDRTATGTLPFPTTGPWDGDRTTEFLTDALVPIRLACHTPSGGLWMLSLWYLYRDDQLCCATANEADVVDFLRADPELAFEVSVNDPPYMGVRGQGTATVEPDDDKVTLEALIDRYLGGTDNSLATRLLAEDREEVVIRIDPTRVSTWDFSDRMDDVA